MKNENLITKTSNILTELLENDGEKILLNNANKKSINITCSLYNMIDLKYLKRKLKNVDFYNYNKDDIILNRIKKLCKVYNVKKYTIKDVNKIYVSNGWYISNRREILIKMSRRDKIKKYEYYNERLVKIFCHELSHRIQFSQTKIIKFPGNKAFYSAFERTADRLAYIIYKKYFSDIISIKISKFNSYINHTPKKPKTPGVLAVNYLERILYKDHIERIISNDDNKYIMLILQRTHYIIKPNKLKYKIAQIDINVDDDITQRLKIVLSEYYEDIDMDDLINHDNNFRHNKEIMIYKICEQISCLIQESVAEHSLSYIKSEIYQNSLVKANVYLSYFIYKKYFSDIIDIPINTFYWRNYSYDKIFK